MSMKKQAVWGMVIVALALTLFVPGLCVAGDLQPPGTPASTMKTLDEIPGAWSQTLSCDSTSNCPRFQIVLGGAAVLDKETGLVWEKSPDHWWFPWNDAIYICPDVTVGNRKGWRLPTIEQLSSLIDPSRSGPALPAGHPFTIQPTGIYWSATTAAGNPTAALMVRMDDYGSVWPYGKYANFYVWCVRGGQGYDGR